MISVVGVGKYAEEVVDAVMQYTNSDKINYIDYNNNKIEKSPLIFIIYTSVDDVNIFISKYLKSKIKYKAIVGVELQMVDDNRTNSSTQCDATWTMPYSRNAPLTISAGIKILLDLGVTLSFSCADFADIVYVIKDKRINGMQFITQSHNNSIEVLTKNIVNKIQIPMEFVKCICTYYYLPKEFKLITQQLADSMDSVFMQFNPSIRFNFPIMILPNIEYGRFKRYSLMIDNTDFIFNGNILDRDITNPLFPSDNLHCGVMIFY